MRTILRIAVAVPAVLCLLAVPAQAEALGPVPGECTDGVLPSGALSRFCVPERGWNGDLLVWAHGYVAFNLPLDFYHIALDDGTSLPDVAQSLGFAFATTSYRQNGLAILEGVEDVRELVEAFRDQIAYPEHTYLFGPSEGGIVTTLSIERHPSLYSGGLSMCGPIGSFRKQLDYWGDFRVLFDYFFPDLIPGNAIQIPTDVINNWFTLYAPRVQDALAARPGAARELIRTSKAPIDPADPTTVETTILNLLWYSIFATNDGIEKLGGNPYDNRMRWYWGSSNDWLVNLRVERFAASPAALANVANYETTGDVSLPLVTLHTTGDEIIPYWHEPLYLLKVDTTSSGSVVPFPVFRYGHCNFEAEEVLGALGLLFASGL
jgi:hypothetical protein